MTVSSKSFLALGAAALVLAAFPCSGAVALQPEEFPSARVSAHLVSAQLSDAAAVGAKNFISNMGARAIGFLGDASLSFEQRREEFRKLLEDSFDMETIGRFAAGSSWRMASPQQREDYQRMFRKMIVNVYAKRLSDYKGENFDVRTFRAEGKKDVMVTSYIVPGGEPEVRVDWRVRYKDGSYRVVDVIVEGVSMAITQRSDFVSVIQRGGGNFQVLLDHMKSQVCTASEG